MTPRQRHRYRRRHHHNMRPYVVAPPPSKDQGSFWNLDNHPPFSLHF